MLKYNNGQIEFVHSDNSAAMDRLYRGFAKNRDWLEAVVSYIDIHGDTSIDDLAAGLSFILEVNEDTASVYIEIAISKLKVLGKLAINNGIISIGDGKLHMSERSMEEIMFAVSGIKGCGPLSEAYYINIVASVNTGRNVDPSIHIYDIDRQIAKAVLKELLKKNILHRHGKFIYAEDTAL